MFRVGDPAEKHHYSNLVAKYICETILILFMYLSNGN
jgi:hypothetical protein